MKMRRDLWDEYFNWLLDRLKWRKKGYNKLLYLMFNTPFEVYLERDNNRLEDGKYLRNHFFLDLNIDGEFMEHPVSVLEVLAALAERIDTEYIGNPSDPRPDIIFWEMLYNLGFDSSEFMDNRVDFPPNQRKFYNKIDFWMRREYDFNGKGSIFPLKSVCFDQRNAEIWDQMLAYLSEKYDDF